MLAIVQGDAFKATVNRLPGYQANESTGVVTDLRTVFPALGKRRKR